MATKDIIVAAGEVMPEPLISAFRELLGPKIVEQALAKGAKIKVTLTSPWPKRPAIKKEKIIVDESYVSHLKALASDEARLESEINKLSGPNILETATFLQVPMSKSSKVRSLREQLFKTIRSEIVWKSIAGHGEERSEARVAEEP